MKVQEKDLYHGAALTQITEHPSFKALNKADDKYGHYLINADTRVMVKHTKAKGARWQFTFQPDDLATLQEDIKSKYKTFVCLVCGHTTICMLDPDQLNQVIDLSRPRAQAVVVLVRKPGASMTVRGPFGELKGKIPHKTFPRSLFA